MSSGPCMTVGKGDTAVGEGVIDEFGELDQVAIMLKRSRVNKVIKDYKEATDHQ